MWSLTFDVVVDEKFATMEITPTVRDGTMITLMIAIYVVAFCARYGFCHATFKHVLILNNEGI